MGVTVTLKGKPFGGIPLSDKQIMRELGLMARERIVKRTRSGLNEDGGRFHPYSADYAATKAKELGGGGVNLTVSGEMLNRIAIVELTDTSVTLGFK